MDASNRQIKFLLMSRIVRATVFPMALDVTSSRDCWKFMTAATTNIYLDVDH